MNHLLAKLEEVSQDFINQSNFGRILFILIDFLVSVAKYERLLLLDNFLIWKARMTPYERKDAKKEKEWREVLLLNGNYKSISGRSSVGFTYL